MSSMTRRTAAVHGHAGLVGVRPQWTGRSGSNSCCMQTARKKPGGVCASLMMEGEKRGKAAVMTRMRTSAMATTTHGVDEAARKEAGGGGGYPFKEIEARWQRYWDEKKTFATPHVSALDTSRPKFYALDMFPYPSGAGLHVGHPEGYTATDIVSRYKRMRGYNVLHPMGWDAFGLPAEQYALQTGTHPEVTTRRNIERFREQLKVRTPPCVAMTAHRVSFHTHTLVYIYTYIVDGS